MPEAVGHYKLLERIGAGGLGEVYRARDTNLGRTVAIKFPPPELTTDPVRRGALLQQAHAVTGLSHPSIATLFDVGEEGGRIYLVFEYVPGQQLSTVIGGRPLNPRRAIELGIQLADALAEAHAEDLVHGDIRPDNIVVTPKDRAKFLDFGMFAFTRGGAARDARGSRNPAPYAPPANEDEDVAGADRDIFELGCLLFEMLTGRQPFGDSRGQPAPLPSIIIRAIPTELDPVVGRAIALDRQARYHSAATLSAELRGVAAILDIRAAANEAEFVDDRPSGVSRLRTWLLVGLVLGAGTGLWVWQDGARLHWRRWFGPPPAPILVVVPFDVDGTMPAIVADGIAEDLMTRLGTTNGLKVVGRSSLRSQRGRDPGAVARDARAAVALTGTIGGDGDQIALETALIDAGTGVELWRQRFSSPKAQLLATETSVVEGVARALALTATVGPEQARTASRLVNPAAYELYLQGRDRDARGDLAAAIDQYEQSLAADRGLAESYAALAAALYRDLVRSGRLDDANAWQRLRRAAENALTADPDLPAAHLAAGLAAPTTREAVSSIRRALELDPSNGGFYGELADQLGDVDPDRAATLYRTSLQLDPQRVTSLAAFAEVQIAMNQFDRADEQIAHGRRVAPSMTVWNRIQGYRQLAQRQRPAALSQLQEVSVRADDPSASLLYVRALAASGRLADAERETTRLVRQYPRFCEARAVRAGLLLDTGARAEAQRETDTILASAAESDPPPARARCAAIAAAAMGDADTAGKWLYQIAAAEPALRMWALPLGGVSGQAALDRSWYPWQKVARSATVMRGSDAIRAAHARQRAQMAGVPSP
jgi:serine/threonine-protein kinase